MLMLTNPALGNLQSLNELAAAAKADFIIHTGDFGFYDEESIKRIADKYAFLAGRKLGHVTD